jgi:IclR family acetate operon transcriptional repressor
MSEKIVPFATANGKAWLASLPREQAMRIAIDAGLGRDGVGSPKAIRTIKALGAELDVTAGRGWGFAREEAEDGVGAIAVPIRVHGTVVGTMSVAAPLMRLPEARLREILPLLRRAADNVSIAWEIRAGTASFLLVIVSETEMQSPFPGALLQRGYSGRIRRRSI